MTYIGDIYIGGKEGDPTTGDIYPSGVCFYLNKSGRTDEIQIDFDDGWDIEIRKGEDLIVARSKTALTYNDILTQGYEQCQKFLDILSVFHHSAYLIRNAGYNHVCLYFDGHEYITREVSKVDLGFESSCKCEVRDKDGNVIEPPPIPKPKWIEAFRYYRLSQTNEDCFEAYRNLFLSFESLLDGIKPYQKDGEKKWLKRTLEGIKKTYPLTMMVPPTWIGDPIDYFVNQQYSKYRCGLFHSKDFDVIIPQSTPNPSEILEAYQYLLKLWREIASLCLKINIGGGGVTDIGFQYMMRGVASVTTNFSLTNDPSPETNNDTQISPLGRDIYQGEIVTIDEKNGPGLALIVGKISTLIIPASEKMYRMGFTGSEKILAIHSHKEGINFAGTDWFEFHLYFHRVNRNSPKVSFNG